MTEAEGHPALAAAGTGDEIPALLSSQGPVADLPLPLADALQSRYRLERELGRGGMATVYLAEDLKHERQVALKVLLPELAHSLGVDRFQREIKLAARLQHPHILSVFDSGEAAGLLWFTMPYVRGESLRDRLRRESRLPVDDALRIAREVAQALQHAHREGVVHRDIKPENILLTEDGSTLVADFGIARSLGHSNTGTTGPGLTQAGTSLGTPIYMAPEQATGQPGLDARVDQYALAVTLHEMLAGEPPFTAPNAAALMAIRFTKQPPAVRATRPDVPAAVDQALLKALSLRADDRFPTIADFSREFTPAGLSSTSSPALSATTAMSTAGAPRRRVPAAALLGIGLLIGMGVLFAWRGAPRGAAGADSAKTLAVLPFENLGDTADAYFADGITDELRGKLTTIPDLEVIARSSSRQYKGSSKPAQEIARELGVRYLLTGTVRWEKTGGGKGRVRVSPELIEVGANGRPTSRWQQPFDAPLTDVFQVQGDIAGQVTSALNVALGASAQQALARAPTANLAAYDAYLKAEAAWQGGAARDAGSLRRAVTLLEQAVALDSTFVLGWKMLTVTRSLFYVNGTPSRELAAATLAAATRTEALAPGSTEGAIARAVYSTTILGDSRRARAILAPALEAAPNDPELVQWLSDAESRLGEWDAAAQHLELLSRLDPRSPLLVQRLASLLLSMRRYPEAQAASDRAIALSPGAADGYHIRATIRLAQGDVEGARAVHQAALGSVDTTLLIAYVSTYDDLYWLLDDTLQRRLLTLPPSAFFNDRGVLAIVRAQTYALRGETALARAYGDTAQREFAAQLRQAPDDAQRHVVRGLALAYAGRHAEAIAEGERAVALMPIRQNANVGPYMEHQLARIYLLAGQPERAMDHLEAVLRVPYPLSRGWLRVDPNWASLKGNPRFEKIVSGS